MNSMSIIVFLSAFAVSGYAFYGLFNPRRSILCALAGILVALGAAPAMLHAWGESRSLSFTIGYLVIGVMGLVATVRQFRRIPPKA